MVRLQIITTTTGIDKYAKSAGMEAVLITLSALPKFHPNPSIGANSWTGEMPDKGHRWIMRNFERVRARLAKKDITISGVRSAEAHQDGCSHVHVMAWANPTQIEAIIQEFKKTKGWKKEPGAQFVIIKNNETLGKKAATAASYVLKYILKTLTTTGTTTDADRDDAWRSTWGIRGVQFFGIPTLDSWRTLRAAKATDIITATPLIAAAWAAARGGRYAAFLEMDGGLGCKKKDRPIQIKTQTDDEARTIIKKIFSFETLSIVIARVKATLTTIQKQKVTVIVNYPREPNNKPKNQNKTDLPPPSTAPPLAIFAFA